MLNGGQLIDGNISTLLQLEHTENTQNEFRFCKNKARSKRFMFKEYLELAEDLYNKGFTAREVIDLILDMVKAENISETLKQDV